MKSKLFCLIAAVVLLTGIQAQAQLLDSAALAKEPEYKDLTEALKNPDKVYKLNLNRHKLLDFPEEILTFKNLQVLILSKNNIAHIPDSIGTLTHLEVLDFSKNDISVVPKEIGNLVNLKKLILNQNPISALPGTIGNLEKMHYLDLWGTNIISLPKEISNLQHTLKVVDMRVIAMRQEYQDKMMELLPFTKFFFSTSCNCN